MGEGFESVELTALFADSARFELFEEIVVI
jgi:hypothetical protein